MASNYVPPFRRSHPTDAPSGDAPPTVTEAQSSNPPSSNSNQFYNNRGGRGGRGSRGGLGGRGGRGGRGTRGGWGNRGGRGAYGNNFFQQQRPQDDVDDADIYRLRDINHHFWPKEADDPTETQSTERRSTERGGGTTFHDSAAHPEELSFLLLFAGANQRWASDRIVFAKSKLDLLPEYRVKKNEHGEWDVPQSPKLTRSKHESGSGATEGPDAEEAKIGDNTSVEDSATNPVQTVISSDGPSPSEQIKELQDIPKSKDGVEQASNGTLEPSVSVPNGGTREAKSVSEDNISFSEVQKSEAKDDPTNATNLNQGDDTSPQSEEGKTEESTNNNSIEEASTSSTMNRRIKYTDIRLEPEGAQPQQPKPQQELEAPSFPMIPPIDYTPSPHTPIAVFEEHKSYGSRGVVSKGRFSFIGWYKVARINILAPYSAELVRMQQQKWERRDRYGKIMPTKSRDASAWHSALSKEWAVVKFEALSEENAPPKPTIEKLPEPERLPAGEDKGVNELLSEMRLGGAKQATGQDGTHDDKETHTEEPKAEGNHGIIVNKSQVREDVPSEELIEVKGNGVEN
ncbi:hypothetical protein F4778DRAFT_746511 [Xylariomycetidae sp. FL2044]|nr:hypothetical protein F4778DRAFT_746511 [Xylariomycetidae sp. FL2044]